MRIERSRLREITRSAERTVYLVSTYLNEFLSLFPGLLACIVPCILCTLEKVNGSQDIRGHEDLGACNGAVNMAFSREVDYEIRIVFCYERSRKLLITDVSVHENVPFITLDVLKVFKISGVRECIKVNDPDVGVFCKHVMDERSSDEACASCHQICDHLLFPFRLQHVRLHITLLF